MLGRVGDYVRETWFGWGWVLRDWAWGG